MKNYKKHMFEIGPLSVLVVKLKCSSCGYETVIGYDKTVSIILCPNCKKTKMIKNKE